jgi:hypothetical protein
MRKAGILAIALIAMAATFGTAVASAKVYYLTPYEQLKFKPKRIEFHDVTLTKLRWRHWGTKIARAHGRSRVNDCVPNCAMGTIHFGSASVRVYHRKIVNGTDAYTCIKGTVKADGDKSRIHYCS